MAEAEGAIADGLALQICEELRAEQRGRLLSWRAWWCWGCAMFSKTPQQRCFAAKPGNRGCSQVNERYDAVYGPYAPRGGHRQQTA